jgi:hypothetical protein
MVHAYMIKEEYFSCRYDIQFWILLLPATQPQYSAIEVIGSAAVGKKGERQQMWEIFPLVARSATESAPRAGCWIHVVASARRPTTATSNTPSPRFPSLSIASSVRVPSWRVRPRWRRRRGRQRLYRCPSDDVIQVWRQAVRPDSCRQTTAGRLRASVRKLRQHWRWIPNWTPRRMREQWVVKNADRHRVIYVSLRTEIGI